MAKLTFVLMALVSVSAAMKYSNGTCDTVYNNCIARGNGSPNFADCAASSASCVGTATIPSYKPTHTPVLPHYPTTTEIVTSFTTYCPSPTTFVHGKKTYTVTKATTLTITDCPCTITKPVSPYPTTHKIDDGPLSPKPTTHKIDNGPLPPKPTTHKIDDGPLPPRPTTPKIANGPLPPSETCKPPSTVTVTVTATPACPTETVVVSHSPAPPKSSSTFSYPPTVKLDDGALPPTLSPPVPYPTTVKIDDGALPPTLSPPAPYPTTVKIDDGALPSTRSPSLSTVPVPATTTPTVMYTGAAAPVKPGLGALLAVAVAHFVH